MGLNETTKQMRDLLMNVSADLEKAAQGNKAAAQRVRTQTIRLEKIAKNYRRESINAEKAGNFPKRPSQQKKAQSKNAKPAAKAAAKSAKAAPKQAQKAKAKAPAKAAPKRAPQKAQKSNAKSAYRR